MLYNNSTSYPEVVDRIRIQAIARKGIRNGQNWHQIENTLLADSYLQGKKAILNDDRIQQLTRNTLLKALAIENNTAKENMKYLL